jgi:hypothetical protein
VAYRKNPAAVKKLVADFIQTTWVSGPKESWCIISGSPEGRAMGQIVHWSATTTEAVCQALPDVIHEAWLTNLPVGNDIDAYADPSANQFIDSLADE